LCQTSYAPHRAEVRLQQFSLSSCIPHSLDDASGLDFLTVIVYEHMSAPRPKGGRGRRPDATAGTRNEHGHSLKVFGIVHRFHKSETSAVFDVAHKGPNMVHRISVQIRGMIPKPKKTGT